MARIAILGATGKLGQRLVARALEQGFSVNALARDPRAIKSQNERVTIIKGDAQTGEGLDALFERTQYAVCAIGSLKPVMESCMTTVLPFLEGLKRFERFVFISRLGTGESRPQSAKVSGPIQSALPVLLTPIFRDINLAEAKVRESAAPWTILRSTRLTDDSQLGEVAIVGPTEPPPHRIGRTALAHFVIDLLESPDFVRREMTVGAK